MYAPETEACRSLAGALSLLIAAGFMGPLPAGAQSASVDTSIYADNQEDTYRRCLSVANTHPESGFDMARRWIRLGGGEPAEHCAAAALVGLGDPEEAATRMGDLVERSTASPQIKAGLWAHIGRAWMDAGDYALALEALTSALALHDGDSEMYLDRALCHAAMDDLWSAVDDLNRVIDRHDDALEALVLRSSAYRQLEVFDLALADIDRILDVDPNSLDAHLEKGLLAVALGETQAARTAWVRVLEIAPDSATADAVRLHLERLDVSPGTNDDS